MLNIHVEDDNVNLVILIGRSFSENSLKSIRISLLTGNAQVRIFFLNVVTRKLIPEKRIRSVFRQKTSHSRQENNK